MRAATFVLASFFDGLLMAVLLFGLSSAVGEAWWTQWLIWAAVAALETWLVATYGWNLAKLVIGLRVVDERGDPPGLRRAVVRVAVLLGPLALSGVLADLLSADDGSAAAIAGWIGIVWPVLLLFTIANGDRHQGWHDRAAGTFVVTRSST